MAHPPPSSYAAREGSPSRVRPCCQRALADPFRAGRCADGDGGPAAAAPPPSSPPPARDPAAPPVLGRGAPCTATARGATAPPAQDLQRRGGGNAVGEHPPEPLDGSRSRRR